MSFARSEVQTLHRFGVRVSDAEVEAIPRKRRFLSSGPFVNNLSFCHEEAYVGCLLYPRVFAEFFYS